jgi:hypothetical protein
VAKTDTLLGMGEHMIDARRILFLLLIVVGAAPAAAQVVLTARSATVPQPGDVADLCVSMQTGGEAVAGVQNDLTWDGRCATLRSAGSCRINPATGKQLYGGFPPQFDFTYRALVLSVTDVGPIPDGELYCCSFIAEAPPGGCCPIAVVRAGASDPRGNLVPASGNTAQLCVAGDGTPIATATPLPGADGGDGCQVGGAPAGGAAVWLLLAPLALAAPRARAAQQLRCRARASSPAPRASSARRR